MKVKLMRSRDGDQLRFTCPGCGENHAPYINGTGHPVWGFNGDYDKPTFTPSLLVRSGHYAGGHNGEDCWCNWSERNNGEPAPFKCTVCHSFVTDGKIQFLSDCTHALAGQTVELPEMDD